MYTAQHSLTGSGLRYRKNNKQKQICRYAMVNESKIRKIYRKESFEKLERRRITPYPAFREPVRDEDISLCSKKKTSCTDESKLASCDQRARKTSGRESAFRGWAARPPVESQSPSVMYRSSGVGLVNVTKHEFWKLSLSDNFRWRPSTERTIISSAESMYQRRASSSIVRSVQTYFTQWRSVHKLFTRLLKT